MTFSCHSRDRFHILITAYSSFEIKLKLSHRTTLILIIIKFRENKNAAKSN